MTAESWRVAQVVVDRGLGDEGLRGSGYLVAPGLVLTAAHVVAGARTVRVRLDVGQPAEVEVQAEGWWADPAGSIGTDLAIVMIPAAVSAGRDVGWARFGRVGDGMAVLAVQAFGFPRFKLRASPGGSEVFRDLEQVTGHAPIAANRRQGTLAVYLDDPPPAAPEHGDPSPWAGMSGAAVWADGRIVAMVAEHHPGEGTGRLTARRIDRAYGQLPEADLGRLVCWLGLPSVLGGLADVVPAGPGQLIRSAYTEQVLDIAPDALIGRDGELAEWAEFCAGPDRYAWWQAGPWAGKSALASWFVTHPPAGVDVVSFFITGRLAGQADSDAFLDAMIEQLNALAPGGGTAVVPRARMGAWLSLLASAAAQAGERSRRLVVVVDGLDEDDTGAAPARGRPSIASLLPRRLPAGVRVIVTSRPDPGLPDDVPSGHPLRTCVARRLPVSWVAEDLELRAKQELRDLLAGDQTAIDVVGYLAASGGGLTRSDLSALTGAAPLRLDPILRGVFGRSLQTRTAADAGGAGADAAMRVYLFAHETLRATAEDQLGNELARYRDKIHDWIGSYVSGGWPDTAPGYAIRAYPGLLAATSDADRLSALARDPRRHTFLLLATGSDYAALAEIGTAQRLIAAQHPPDLRALVELAVYRNALSIRNQSIPPGLPAVWERLGRLDHAEALARTFTGTEDRAHALTELAKAAAQAGDPDRAEALARTVSDPLHRVWALAELVTIAAQAGDPDRASRLAAEAEALAPTITYPNFRAEALKTLASAAATAGDLDHAEVLARSITVEFLQNWALNELVGQIALAGDPDRAEALARTMTDPDDRVWALTELASAVARTGDPDRASRLATEAEALARTITDPGDQAQALTELTTLAARGGHLDRASRLATEAEALARAITDPGDQARALSDLADALVQASDPDRAEALARAITDPGHQAWALAQLAGALTEAGDLDRAEALARAIPSPGDQAHALTYLAEVLAQAGDMDRAEAVARAIPGPGDQARALAGLGGALAQAGDLDRAARLSTEVETMARTITDLDEHPWPFLTLASAAARAGDLDHAEAMARAIPSPSYRARTLAELASAAGQAGDPDRASRLASEAEALARAIPSPGEQMHVLTELATAAVQAGDLDRGEALTRILTHLHELTWALTRLAGVVAEAGDLDRASRLATEVEASARATTDPEGQAATLTELARLAARVGDPDRAARLATEAEAAARTIDEPSNRARALAALAGAVAQVGDPDRAARLADEAEAVARTITDPEDQAHVLAQLAGRAQADDPDRAARLATEAEALVRTLTEPDGQALPLAALVDAAVQASDLDRAEALARSITDPSSQARAFAAVAGGVHRAGDTNRARYLLALALSADSPVSYPAIEEVSRLFPSVIRAAADVFITAYQPGA